MFRMVVHVDVKKELQALPAIVQGEDDQAIRQVTPKSHRAERT